MFFYSMLDEFFIILIKLSIYFGLFFVVGLVVFCLLLFLRVRCVL